MKKFLFSFLVLSLAAAGLVTSFKATAQADKEAATLLPSPNLVISQIQPGTTANPNDEFIELHNIGAAPVDLNGHILVYRSSSGVNDVGPMATWSTSTIVLPGQYYLIASTSYSGTATPDVTYNPTTCSCSLSATAGGMAIRQGAVNAGTIIDAIGWGAATNIFFEGTRVIAPGSGNSQGTSGARAASAAICSRLSMAGSRKGSTQRRRSSATCAPQPSASPRSRTRERT